MKRWIKSSEDIFCMSDVRGSRIKVESNVPFSFYYSARNSSHEPRVKIVFDATKIKSSKMSNLELTGDWNITINPEAGNISSKQINQVKQFFNKYLVLIMIAWEGLLEDEASVRDYLEGEIALNEFIQHVEFYDDYKEDMDKIKTVADLETFCRENDLVNFYGN